MNSIDSIDNIDKKQKARGHRLGLFYARNVVIKTVIYFALSHEIGH